MKTSSKFSPAHGAKEALSRFYELGHKFDGRWTEGIDEFVQFTCCKHCRALIAFDVRRLDKKNIWIGGRGSFKACQKKS